MRWLVAHYLIFVGQPVLYFENFDLETVVSPIDYSKLDELLQLSGYNQSKTSFIVDGLKNGFSIGYEGDQNIKMTSPDLALTVGTEVDLWNKIMKEVQAGRYAGPFTEIPFQNYIQSPIGLVPKDNGSSTRLIFHLSYPRSSQHTISVNANTPRDQCRVKYQDFNMAIKRCIEEGPNCHLSIADIKSAFRVLGICPQHWKYLIMKARSPLDGRIYYFVDKCLPFGVSISCALFQAFSDTIAYLVKWRARQNKDVVNYLDDFLFIALLKLACRMQLNIFTDLCTEINLPISVEKTQFPTTRLVFLGLLINTVRQMIFLPKEKIAKGIQIVEDILTKKSKKVTIKELQKLCGFLNFLGRAVVPGRAFTR